MTREEAVKESLPRVDEPVEGGKYLLHFHAKEGSHGESWYVLEWHEGNWVSLLHQRHSPNFAGRKPDAIYALDGHTEGE